MKLRIIISAISLLLLFNACIVDNIYESSLLLDSITEVRLTSNDTLFLKKDGTFEIRYSLKYYSNQVEINLKNTIKPKLFLNGTEVENTEIDLSKDSVYTLEAEFPNNSKILSNKQKIRVLTLGDAVAEIWLKPLNDIYLINKVETKKNNLTDFVEITAKLKTTEIVDLKPFIEIYSLEYNDLTLSNLEIGNLPDGKFKLKATVGQVSSNSIDLEVFDPMTYIKSIDLILDERTRNIFAVAGTSELDFTYQVIGMDDTVLPIPATLVVDGQKEDSFKDVLIKRDGVINVFAEISGKKSNTIQIISRPNIALSVIKVPVIFHILDNTNTQITQSMIDFEMDKLNLAFANKFQSQSGIVGSSNAVNIFMEFFLVDKDESGNPLQEQGINRITSGGQIFNMSANDRDFLFENMWDPRRFVNVFIGRMDSPGGYAYYPVIKDKDLPGMSRVSDWYQLNYPYSTVLSDRVMGLPNNTTLAHEIGHMLALFHTFDNNREGNQCVDGDYCPDTESHFINPLVSQTTIVGNILENCQNLTFYSSNIMDYVYTSNSFTYDQRERMRTAAVYAPFFGKESNFLNGRLSPFTKGKLDYSIEPQSCAIPNHFGRKYHSH